MNRLGVVIGIAASCAVIGMIASNVVHNRTAMPSTHLPFGADSNQQVSTTYTPPKTMNRITMIAGAGPGLIRTPTSETATAAKLLAWLQTAHMTTVNIPSSDSRIAPGGGDPRLPRINFEDGSRSLSIQRVLYLTDTPNGVKFNYIPDVVELDEGCTVTYLYSKPLYDWLSGGAWLSEFLPHSQTQADDTTP